jgi:hypothetical protein
MTVHNTQQWRNLLLKCILWSKLIRIIIAIANNNWGRRSSEKSYNMPTNQKCSIDIIPEAAETWIRSPGDA